MIRTYTELKQLSSFEDRYEYLRLHGEVGKDTFGFDRIFNQQFYRSPEWKQAKTAVVVRDMGCDLGDKDRPIAGNIIVHHMNPISLKDIQEGSDFLFNPEYLISVSHATHNAIHYGDSELLPKPPVERAPNDTCPWKR